MEFKKINNGHAMVLVVDENHLYTRLDEYVKSCDDLIAEVEKDPELDIRESLDDHGLPTCVIGEDYGEDREYDMDYIKELRQQYESAKEKIRKGMENDAAIFWDMMSYKKNGTFKKTVKPMVFEHSYGDYWEDSYGWNTMVIRFEAKSDTKIELKLYHTVIHY